MLPCLIGFNILNFPWKVDNVLVRNCYDYLVQRAREGEGIGIELRDLGAGVAAHVKGLGQRIGADVHPGHFGFINPFVVDIKLSLARELPGLGEVQLQLRHPLGQRRGLQGVVDTVQEVVVIVEPAVLDKHGEAAGHAAHAHYDPGFVTGEIYAGNDGMRAGLNRSRGLLGMRTALCVAQRLGNPLPPRLK